MISITSEKSSVQSTESTFDQAYQAQETKTVHIVNETTSGEQSGAEHPSKYGYAIFEGYAGEEYLKDLVREILPAALYRTWAIAVGFQAPTNACYVGVSRIAEKAKRGVRQIQKDKREMQLRGLLARYAGSVQVKEKDGTWSRKVRIINDFGGLYDLAYEYHEWKRSAEYVEAEWEAAEYIREDAELYEKLIRFDCYRRILMCEKPGPKTELSELQQAYEKRRKQNEQERKQEENGQQEAKTNKYLPKQLIKSSPYEESKNPQESITYRDTYSSLNLEEGVFESVEPTTIRNVEQSDQTGTRTIEQITNEVEETKYKWREEVKTEEVKQSENFQEREIGAETVKDEIEYDIEHLKQNPLAMVGMLLTLQEQERLKGEQEQAKKKHRHHKDQPKRKRQRTPERLALVITQMVQQLGGNPKYLQSDITRVSKIYWASIQIFTGFRNAWFLEQLTETFVKVCKARRVKNRVAYFFTCLEKHLEMTAEELVYIRSAEPLYTDGDLKTFVITLQQSYERSGSQLDYEQWVQQNYLKRPLSQN